MRYPSISAGDVNGDGYDELIAAGFYSNVKTNTPGYAKAIDYDKITAENIVVKRDSIFAIKERIISSGCCFIAGR